MRQKLKKRAKRLAKRGLNLARRNYAIAKDQFERDPQVSYDIDVSVVIPVYNCEEYIEQTIRSISDHTSCRYEIIAINDESPDDVLRILRDLEAEIPQLKVHDQTNIGGANTLNRGLGLAQGKYVTCLDCDDWLAPGALDVLFKTAEDAKAQVVAGVVQKYTNGLYDDIHDFAYIKSRMDIRVAAGIPEKVFNDSFYTGKLFRRSHLQKHGITFVPDLLYADRPFVTKSIVTARKVVMIPKIVAFWRKHLDGRSVTDGFSNPSNLIDKMTGFGALLRDPAVTAREDVHKTLFLEAVKRLFWNYEDVDDPTFATAFAYAGRALVAGYPNYHSLPGSDMSLRRKLILDQIRSHPDDGLHAYKIALEQAIDASAGQPVAQVAVMMKSVRHVGTASSELPPYPVVKNPTMYVFESFFGKSFGANPRYLYEELVRRGKPFTAVWVHSPARRPFKIDPPPYVNLVQVARGSAQYTQALREARYWVNNIRFPEMEKPPGTIYIQTWHGTPLKRLGLDIDADGPEALARESFLKDAAQWDYLLAQNEYSAEIFARAFDVKCPIIVDGYPANDVLSDAGKRARAARQIRRKYNIPEGKKILTYAPTWRDRDQVGDKWVFANKIHLDFQALRKAIGDEYVVVLRLHHLMARSVSFSGLEGFLYDGSKEPDANRLMAATDLLVTDYSSIFFDYACSGKPMLFYMYDLDEYETELRGFYIDPRTELPGPIVQTQEALVAAIRQAGQSIEADRYPAFRDKYLDWDKGKSAKTVADRVFARDRNVEDIADLDVFRKARAQMAEVDHLRATSIWSDADFAHDVTLSVHVERASDLTADLMTRLQAHHGASVQVVVTGPKGLKAPSQDVTCLTLPKTAGLIDRLEAVTQVATGKYLLPITAGARWRPDTLALLFAKADNARAALVVRRPAGAADASRAKGALDSADLVAAGAMDRTGLDGMMMFTDFLRRHLPTVQDRADMLPRLLVARARRAVWADVMPQDTEANDPVDTPVTEPDLALSLLHAIGDASPAASRQVFADAFVPLADTLGPRPAAEAADLRTAQALVSAFPLSTDYPDTLGEKALACLKHIRGEDPVVPPRPTSSELSGDPSEDRDYVPKAVPTRALAQPVPPVSFEYDPRPQTWFVCAGASGLGARAREMVRMIAGRISDARIVVEGDTAGLTDEMICAPGVQIRPVATGALDYWYWASQASHVLADGPVPDDLTQILQRRPRRISQLATCQSLVPLGWADVGFVGPQVMGDGSGLGAAAADWSDLIVDAHTAALWSGTPDFAGRTLLPTRTLSARLLDDPDQRAQQNESFRLYSRIQRNRTLIGVLQLTGPDGRPEVLIDTSYLRAKLPPNCDLFVYDTAAEDRDQLNGFLCACDMLISPPHPAVVDYASTGKPLLPQDSFLFASKGVWANEAAKLPTHDALAEAIAANVTGPATPSALLDTAKQGLTQGKSEVLTLEEALNRLIPEART